MSWRRCGRLHAHPWNRTSAASDSAFRQARDKFGGTNTNLCALPPRPGSLLRNLRRLGPPAVLPEGLVQEDHDVYGAHIVRPYQVVVLSRRADGRWETAPRSTPRSHSAEFRGPRGQTRAGEARMRWTEQGASQVRIDDNDMISSIGDWISSRLPRRVERCRKVGGASHFSVLTTCHY